MTQAVTDTDQLDGLFELRVEIPHERFLQQGKRMIGFAERYGRLHRDLRLLIDRDGLEGWSKKHYGRVLPIVLAVQDRYPLVIFHGDVGNGKTATAEACGDALARELSTEGVLMKLSTRVRGSGMVGQMSSLIARAFEVVAISAGKKRLAVLIIDEADSLAASRDNEQSHHEDKVAVNTLIQRIDDVRQFNGRVLVFLCTNRFDSLDPAILRRAGLRETFERPADHQRRALLEMDCDGLNIDSSTLDELVRLTGANGERQLGFTYSDIRTRLIPEALARAFPDRKLIPDDLVAAATGMSPSPTTASRLG
jgi:SpoVK/Ycf46/Vps4 family AAA+-type ATPase